MQTRTAITTAAALLAAMTAAADTTAGWREVASTNVVADAAATFDGRLTVGGGGALAKIGAGALTLPQSRIDRSAPYAVQALEGTLSIAAGAASTNAAAPAFVAAEAAFWVDATPGNGLQTVDDNGTARVTRWCDVRETDPAARTYPSALPAHVATGRSNENSANPVAKVFRERASVHFGGLGSGQWMAFKDAADANLAFDKAFHFFVVHGIGSSWGPVLGHTGTGGSSGFRVNGATSASAAFKAFDALDGGHFYSTDAYNNGGLVTSRFTLDGQPVNAFATSPRPGVQLLAGTVSGSFQKFNNFFNQRGNTYVVGGDYLCEAILFTNKLSEAEFAQVERYLLAKWKIPGCDSLAHLDADLGSVGVASNAVVSVTPAEGAATGPLAFSGEGTVTKTGAGDLVVGPSGDKPPFSGDFALGAGRILVRGGMSPALAVSAGQTLDASYNVATNLGTPTVSEQVSDATVVTLSQGGETEFAKTGGAEARVKSVADGVAAISVSNGTLVLAAPETGLLYDSGAPWAAGASLNVTIPNAGFEEYFAQHPEQFHLQSTSFNTEYNGWRMTSYKAYFIHGANPNWASSYCKASIPPAEGNAVLFLKNVDSVAYTTVTLPKDGTYELSCVSSANKASGTAMGVWAGPTWATATQIGSLPDGQTPWPRTYCRFTAAAGTYAIGFKTGAEGTAEYGWVIDDLKLRFVAEADAAAELVPNGGFEKSSGYSASSTSAGRVRYVNNNMDVSGYNAYEGGYCFQLSRNGWVSWSVEFPSAGPYRLRFAAHSRTQSRRDYGFNPIVATLAPSGGAAVAILTAKPFGCNFYEHSALFRVSEAGTYTLKLQGTSSTDRRTYIDGVSVRAATAADAPSVPGKPKVSVAAGATLLLDYPGTVTVSSLKLGGVSHTGIVTAADAPEYLQGIGSIRVEPDCTVICVR